MSDIRRAAVAAARACGATIEEAVAFAGEAKG